MARSKLDTLVYATILLAPLATAIGYIALTPEPEPVIVTIPAVAQPSLQPEPAPTPPTLEPTTLEPTQLEPTTLEPTTPEPSTDLAAEPGAAVLVHERQLLLSTTGDQAWTHGRLRAHPLEDGMAASKAVDPTRLPAQLQPLVDARFILHSPDGSSCTANAGALSLYARQDGELDYLDGVLNYTDDGMLIEPTPAQLLAQRKAVFADAHLLFARLTGNPRCNGLWARRADLPAPTVFAAVTLDEAAEAALKDRVLAVIEAQPAVVDLRIAFDAYLAEYIRNNDEPAELTWPEFLRSTLKVSRWDELGGPRQLLNVELGDGDQGCGDYFTDQVAMVFTLAGEQLQPHADAGFIGPSAVMDLERDGHLEAVTASGHTIETRGPATAHQSFEFPYYGCRC